MTQALNSEFRPQIGLAYVSQLSMARHLFLKIIVILVRGHSITTWTNEGGGVQKINILIIIITKYWDYLYYR